MTPEAVAAFDVETLRKSFPALAARTQGRELVYFDSACTALKSAAVADSSAAFYREVGACGGKRSTHLLAQRAEEALQEARRAAARFIGAESENEVVFTSGATEAANLLARAFPYGPRREVVLTDLEHNAVFLPFYEAARRGEVELKFCRSREGRVDPKELDGLVTDKTALVCLTRASNVMGGVQPLAEVCRRAHAKGACVFSDEAQYLSSHREDVRAVNVDFIAFSAHKLGGPFGLGVLYGKEQRLNALAPYKVGGGSIKSVELGKGLPEVRYLDAPGRFESGVANFSAFDGLREALSLLEGLPSAALRAHVGGLVRRAAEGLARLPYLKVLGRTEDLTEGSLLCFYPADARFSLADFNLYLNHELEGRFIAVRVGEHCAHLLQRSQGLPPTMRLSFFAYNTEREVDLFLEAVQAYAQEAFS